MKKAFQTGIQQTFENKDKKAEALWKKKTADIIKHLNEISAMEKQEKRILIKYLDALGKSWRRFLPGERTNGNLL